MRVNIDSFLVNVCMSGLKERADATVRRRCGWSKLRELAPFLTPTAPSMRIKGQVYTADQTRLTLWQAERHFCPYRLTGAATILSFGHRLFTILDYIGSAVGKRPIGYATATSECPTNY